ncbi:SF1B family DNA helicase RecD2 [Anaerococcus tetradius]|uniref:ATP-dependent RecD2 DNA helicase n=1 Tax=Anaerococcus tetradius ATCC 35098 TaxID=525255 RepID=C2CG74_9FIRM|nr:ATP-dependent RecD-like DNA helicase [Anaerococcus tetradius]EEI83401.1 helicase, RecD/TraA family [Anaerococcus tetradius ATCC 35098]
MKIKGIVTNIIFRNDDSGYTILSVDTSDSDITCVGTMPFFNQGDNVEMEGEIVYHDKYGEQFNISSISLLKPSSRSSIIKFLSSGNLKGIGKKTAEAIYEAFGKDSIDLVYQNTDRLLEVEGIGKKKLEDIKLSVEETRDSRRSIEYLQGLNISYSLAMKIYQKYGESTIDLVKHNPYKLVEDIRGIGFTMADNIALNMQMDSSSKFRISAGLYHVLNAEADLNGHTCLKLDYLVDKSTSLLKLEVEKIKEVINDDVIAGKLVLVAIKDVNYIYSASLLKAEKSVAMALASKIDEKYIFDIDFDYDLSVFSDEQREAIKMAFESMALVITGGPGTGKTTIINAICKILSKNKLSYALAAPTGRAAKRIKESTGEDAYTIHRLIGIRPDEIVAEYNEDNPIEKDYLIVDEMSMVDIHLMKNLLAAVGEKTAIILVGDSDQLPSVGPGNVLKDILDTDIKSVRLKKIFRQAGKSNIIVNAHRINEGKYPILNEKDKDFFFIDADNRNFMDNLINLLKVRLPEYYKFDPIKDIQILSPSKKTDWGVANINEKIQEAINKENESLKVNNRLFKLKDKVMQVRNNYDLKAINHGDDFDEGVYNGDIGFVEKIDTIDESLDVRFDDGRLIRYKKEDIKDLDLSYAITIHKSQGSEFPCLIIPMMQVAPMLLTRNLLYTGVTRARKIVILLGKKNILKTMVDNNRSNRRFTNLSYWIREMGKVIND